METGRHVVSGKKATSYLAEQSSAISRKCKIVALANEDPKLNGQMPPRTVFVGVDDEAIVADAFNLMRKRGLENFAFVHTVEASEILRGASHTPRPLRGSVFGLGGNSYAIPRS